MVLSEARAYGYFWLFEGQRWKGVLDAKARGADLIDCDSRRFPFGWTYSLPKHPDSAKTENGRLLLLSALPPCRF